MDRFTVYKYRAINDWSLDTLASGRMWFSNPAKFNDTFEFSLPLFVSLSSFELVSHFEKRFAVNHVAPQLLDAMMQHGGSNSFPATTEFVNDFLRSNKDGRALYVMALIGFLREQGESTEAIIRNLKLNEDNELRAHLERELREAYHRNQAIGYELGVLSLSAKPDVPPMWAHYADSCRGMCIGITFDIDRLIESDFIPLWVDYADELPRLNPSHFFDPDPANVMEMLKIFYATKHNAWKYEFEFRLISQKGDLAFDLPGKITEVILGEKAANSDARRVLNAIERQKGIKLLKMLREPGTWNYRAYGTRI